MSKMKCVEEVYDVLVEAGLDVEHDCFEDLLFGCVALATGEAESDLVTYVEDYDRDRTGAMIASDIYTYVRNCGSKERPSAIIARAVAAGKVGWEQ